MSQSYDAIVIGAGISGAATAYHLRKGGMTRVLMLEREAGPAHGPTRDSAAVVRMHYSEPVLVRMAMESRDMFNNMKALLGKDGGFEERGWFLALPADMMPAAERNIDMQRRLGLKTGFLSDKEIQEKAPWLNMDGVAGVLFEPESGYADPVHTTEAFAEAFQRLGGECRFRTPCRGLIRNGERITGVMLEDGPISAGMVVNAAGPWSKYLAKTAGLELQLRAVREQDAIWEVRPNRPMPQCSFSTAIEAAYCRALGDGRFILGLGYPKQYHDVDPYNYKHTMDDDFRMVAFEKNAKRIPNLEGARFVSAYASLYDITPDFYPFVGPRAGLAGYADYCGGSPRASSMADWAAIAADRSPLTRNDREQHPGRLRPVQVKRGSRLDAVRVAAERLAGSGIDIEPGKIARGHVEADAVSGLEQVRDRRQQHGKLIGAPRLHHLLALEPVAEATAQDRVDKVHVEAFGKVFVRRMDVDELGGDIGVDCRRGDPELDLDGARDLDVG